MTRQIGRATSYITSMVIGFTEVISWFEDRYNPVISPPVRLYLSYDAANPLLTFTKYFHFIFGTYLFAIFF